MFTLLANETVSDLALVPDDFKPLYTKSASGDFVIAETHKAVAKAIDGINGVNAKLRQDVQTLGKKADLSALKDYGDDPETISKTVGERLAELQANLEKGKSGALDVEKVRNELKSQHTRELEAIKADLGKVTTAYHNRIISDETRAACQAEKGDSDLILPLIRERVKIVDVKGQARPVIVDEVGELRVSPTTGEPLSVAEYIKALKADKKFGKLFESEAPNGGGANPNRIQSNQIRGQDTSKMTPMQKISAGLAART